MGLNRGGYLWVVEAYDGDERGECITYQKLLSRRNPDTGRGLDWNERVSEIMDHMSRFIATTYPFPSFLALYPSLPPLTSRIQVTPNPLTLLYFTLLTPPRLPPALVVAGRPPMIEFTFRRLSSTHQDI